MPQIGSAVPLRMPLTGLRTICFSARIQGGIMPSEQFVQEGKQHFVALKFAEAEKSFRSALEADAKSIDGHMELARVCALRGKSDEAEKFINEVLALAPENAVALAWKGLLCMR